MAAATLPGQYFLLAHDGYTGRLHINQELFDAGVAAALLAELLLTGHIAVAGGELTVVDAGPADPVAAAVLGVLRQGGPAVAGWVARLAGAGSALVGDELVRAGVVTRPPARRLDRLWLSGPRHVAVDALAAAAPRVLLRHAASGEGSPDADRRTRALAALAVATGLEHVVADGANRAARGRLRDLAAGVDGDLRGIVDGVEAAAVRIALRTRRGQ